MTGKIYTVYRPSYQKPYLGNELTRNYKDDSFDFFNLLGDFVYEECEVEKDEKVKMQELDYNEKLELGLATENIQVQEVGSGILKVVIENQSCNFGGGDPVILTSKKFNDPVQGFILESDGEILTLDVELPWGLEKGDLVGIEKNFTFFNYKTYYWVNDYYRLYRSEKHISKVQNKILCKAENLNLNIKPLEKHQKLDGSQLQAFNSCLSNDPVTLVQGPPGTGKTTFAASLAKHLKDLGFTILVTAFTHDAINNILRKVLALGASVKKIGRLSKSTEELIDSNSAKFESYFRQDYIIGMTVHELLKNHYEFDFIIVDEASQMDIVSGLHFLASSIKSIFIGDQMQLPNISKIPDTEFSISIFDLLLKYHKPQTLQTTYRFNQGICDYISPNFYNGLLTCGESAKYNFLSIESKPTGLKYPQVFEENPLVFIHTEQEVEFIMNEEQANITADLIEDFLLAGLQAEDLGIIAPTNMQCQYIKKVLATRKIPRKGIQIDTVNKFQGQEKNVIIYNTVITKAENDQVKYDFYFDIRRFNVAVSRAKQKVVVLGNGDMFLDLNEAVPGKAKIQGYLNYSKTFKVFTNI